MAEGVHFFADGLKLAAGLYLPEGASAAQPVPGLVFCHGFGATREYVAPETAAALAAAGYAVLIFDHRGFGESEGARWRLRPLEQVEDIRAALVYLTTRPEVDVGRLGLYGISFGGANAIYAAAIEPLVRCTVSCVPFSDGEHWMREIRRYWEWVDFTRALETDRVERALTGRSRMVDPDQILVRDPESVEWNAYLKERYPSRRQYQLPLETGQAIVEYKPIAVAHQAARLLIIAVANDTLMPLEQPMALHARAQEPKRLVVLPDLTHHDIYRGSAFGQVVDLALAWYREHL